MAVIDVFLRGVCVEAEGAETKTDTPENVCSVDQSVAKIEWVRNPSAKHSSIRNAVTAYLLRHIRNRRVFA